MPFYAQMDSPLGVILLCSNGTHLSGLYFAGQKDCPEVQGLAQVQPGHADPTAGTLQGAAIKDFKVYKHNTEPDLFAKQEAGNSPLACIGQDPINVYPVSALEGFNWHVSAHKLTFLQDHTPKNVQILFEQAQQELFQYFAGRLTVFTVPLCLEGTDFQKKVWQALLNIPYGECVSYGDVAKMAGLTAQHGRPVGTAVGRNPLTIIVPCHRVLAGSGRLNGYTGGLERKFALLALEGFSLR